MPAELFKVTCVTCQSSLSVRNPALIDQIVACPKCDSMVHVVPPAAPKPVPVAAPVLAAAPIIEPPTFEDSFEPLASSAEPTIHTPEAPPTPTVLEVGSASNTTFIMWAAGSFVVGVTLMGAFLMLWGRDDKTVAASPTTTPITQPDSSSEPNAGSEGPKTELPAPSPSPGDAADQAPADEDPFADSAKTEPEAAEPSLLGPIEQPEGEPVAVAATNDESPLTPPQDEPGEKLVIGSADEPRVARKFDPLTVDPEELNLAEMTEAAAGEEQPEGEALLEGEQEEARPMNAIVPVRLDQESAIGSANRVALIQLKRELPAITTKDMPLLDFLTLAGQLAGVPVSVGPEQLQMAGITPGRPVSMDKTDATLGEVLKSVLEPLHLESTTEGPQIVIIRQDADKVRSVDYPVDDLLGSKLTASEFAEWIEKLIAPESWQSAGGDGTINVSGGSLKIEQTQAVQYQVLFFLERIRLAKGLPLRSKYPARLLSGKPYATGIADRLKAPATFTFSHNTPLAEVFHYWQGEAGMPIFVDWPALASVELWPDSRITCTSANEPWQTAFDKILTPLDLAWRPVPGGAVQITSRGRVETEPVVDIYPTGTWHGDATDAVVIDDPVNGLTYVRAPAAAHRD